MHQVHLLPHQHAHLQRSRFQDILLFQWKEKEVDKAILRTCKDRNDDAWAIEVEGRISLVNDLRAEDALYHRECNTHFHLLKPRLQTKESGSRKRGRHVDIDKEQAFSNICVSSHFVVYSAESSFCKYPFIILARSERVFCSSSCSRRYVQMFENACNIYRSASLPTARFLCLQSRFQQMEMCVTFSMIQCILSTEIVNR